MPPPAAYLLDNEVEPWSIQLELRIAGHLDEVRLRAALAAALSRHPMARARKATARLRERRFQWEITHVPDLDPFATVDCPDDQALAAARADLQSIAIPLIESPPLRVRLARHPDGDVVMLNVKHTAIDGFGALRILRSMARGLLGPARPAARPRVGGGPGLEDELVQDPVGENALFQAQLLATEFATNAVRHPRPRLSSPSPDDKTGSASRLATTARLDPPCRTGTTPHAIRVFSSSRTSPKPGASTCRTRTARWCGARSSPPDQPTPLAFFLCQEGVHVGGADVLTLGAVAAALVAASAQSRARRAAEDHARALDGSVGWLRRIVAADDPTAGSAALARLEETPQSHQRLHELAQILNHRATSDTGFRADLEALIDQARGHGLDITSIIELAWGSTRRPPA